MKTYVLYHANCWDGFCAAWIAHRVLPTDTVFIPVQYGQPEPDMECSSIVYVLDFSYPRQAMHNLRKQMHKVIVLDHHKTAQAELADFVEEFIQRPDLINNIPGSELPVIHFDMNKSGGRLTWEYFHGSDPAPWLVDYTESRDLWRWNLDHSREFNAWLRSYPLDFEVWNEFATIRVGSDEWGYAFHEGAAILRREKQIIDDHV